MDVEEIAAQLSAVVRDLEPDAVPLPEAMRHWEAYNAIVRQGTAAMTLLARRVEESRAWARAGHRSAVEFMAKESGSSVGTARAQLETSQKLGGLPAIEHKMRIGGLSGSQTALLVEGVSANPDAQEQLLEQAERGSLKELRDAVLRARAVADPEPEATQRRIHSRRHYRSWIDAEGAWQAAVRGTVVDGAAVDAALEPLIDELFAKARTEGRREPRESYAFDALVLLATRAAAGTPSIKSNPRYTTIVRADLEALRRGRVEGDEMCEITGIGPIPATTARELLGESILKLVITQGVDVLNVTHLGRGPNAAQKIALLWSSPTCSVEGCSRTRVEIDHRTPYAQSRHTRLDDLDALCPYHHALKTYEGWALVDGTGKRAMVPPDDARHPKNRPKPHLRR